MFRLIAFLLACALVAPVFAQTGKDSATEQPLPKRIVMSFQKQKDPAKIKETADRLGAMLGEALGVEVEVIVPMSYGASVQALISNQAHVAYMDSMPFLLAEREAPVEILLVEQRDGRDNYDSLFVVKKDSPYKALSDLRGARMMFTSPTSTSGYIFAYSRLVNEGFLSRGQDPKSFFGETGYAGGYDRALLAVLNGQADACAVSDYTMEGKKADIYLTAEQRAGLRVLAETPGVPTHLIAVRSDLPASFRAELKKALLKLTESDPDLLADVYGAAELVEPGADHVKKTREAIDNTGLLPETIVGK